MEVKTKNSGHTPGPWDADDFDGACHYIRSEDGRLVVKTALCWPISRTTEEDAANVRLIVAVPELLAAAELAIGVWGRLSLPTAEEGAVALNRLVAAILKAKGRL